MLVTLTARQSVIFASYRLVRLLVTFVLQRLDLAVACTMI